MGTACESALGTEALGDPGFGCLSGRLLEQHLRPGITDVLHENSYNLDFFGALFPIRLGQVRLHEIIEAVEIFRERPAFFHVQGCLQLRDDSLGPQDVIMNLLIPAREVLLLKTEFSSRHKAQGAII